MTGHMFHNPSVGVVAHGDADADAEVAAAAADGADAAGVGDGEDDAGPRSRPPHGLVVVQLNDPQIQTERWWAWR